MCQSEQRGQAVYLQKLRGIILRACAGRHFAFILVGLLHPQEELMVWMIALGMAVVGGFWVKTRRQRKSKENPYVPN